MYRCPKCGSSRIDQYRMPYGEMWCADCGFLIEDKTVIPNPFFVEEDIRSKPEEPTHSSLGEQVAAVYKSKHGIQRKE